MNEGAKLTLLGNNAGGSLIVRGVDLFKELLVTAVQVHSSPHERPTVTIQALIPDVYAECDRVLMADETLAELARMNGFALIPIEKKG